MKIFYLLSFFLIMGNACQKKSDTKDPVPAPTTCLIQKIEYDDGTYEKYVFDANKKLTSSVLTYTDENNKIVEVPLTYQYNSDGNLLKTTGEDGYTDNYTYNANGLLTKVVFTNGKGGLEEEFTVTMDAQKRLTKVIASESGLTGVYEYKGQDNALSRVEVSYSGQVLDLYEITSFEADKTKNAYNIAISGHPFDPGIFTGEMIYNPFNMKSNLGLPKTGKASTAYDENWENLTSKLRVYYDFVATRNFNTNNFALDRTSKDAVSGNSHFKKYLYSNCN